MKTWPALALLLAAPAASAGVAGSKHDLSASGPGEVRAESESDRCIFCHVSHGGGSMSLSNRPDTRAQHRPYESTTMKGRPGAPTGSTRICLSCHDGTIAVGQTRGREIRMRGGKGALEPGRKSNLGTDLRRTHPVSIRSHSSGKLRPPARGDAVKLDRGGLVQCTSCHDPHEEWRDPEVGKFLVKPSARSALCVSCHGDPAAGSRATHLTSSVELRDAESGRARTVAEAGCGACHVPHGADVRGRLLKDGVSDEDLCLGCHARTARRAVALDLSKASAHRTTQPGRHDAAEGPNAPDGHRLPETSPAAARHVVCADCHDPHRSTSAAALGSGLPGALAGVSGVDIDGNWVDEARHEYEICLKCHGDSANQPQATEAGTFGKAKRARPDVNLRLVFSPGAVSFHPVAAPGKSARVPSLRAPYTTASTIRCTDCHASDTGPGATATPSIAARAAKPDLGPREGAAGARGPHGSSYAPILERQYLTGDRTPESPAAYALCYKCHDRDVLLSGASGFPLHRRHVVDQAAPCSTCHAAHGVSREAGNEQNNAHLISFDRSIVRAGKGGEPRYESTGVGHGSCALSCHGADHGQGGRPSSY